MPDLFSGVTIAALAAAKKLPVVFLRRQRGRVRSAILGESGSLMTPLATEATR
jgi:hypothetical protein